jgi:hypothetical protein
MITDTVKSRLTHFIILEFNVSSLHKDKLRLLLKQGGAAPGFSPDDGNGEKEIYRVENFELAPVDPAAYGMFFGGDSYVIKYTYNISGRNRYIIYFWQVNTELASHIMVLNIIKHEFSINFRVMTAAKTRRPLLPFML